MTENVLLLDKKKWVLYNKIMNNTERFLEELFGKNLLELLSPRERNILRMRFGLGYDHHYTLEEVGKEFGVTRERIRQIEAKSLMKIRLHFEN